MTVTQGQIDALKAKQPAIETPPIPWETDPDHPDWGAPTAAQRRKDVIWSAQFSDPFRSPLTKTMRIQCVTAESIKKNPGLYSALKVKRAVWCEPYWRELWASIREQQAQKRENRIKEFDYYLGIDGLEEGPKFYASGNPEILKKIEKRVDAQHDYGLGFFIPLPTYSEYPHLFEIEEIYLKAATWSAARAERDKEWANLSVRVIAAQTDQVKNDDMIFYWFVGFLAIILAGIMIGAAQ
jgi:hypothetical protein